ncbi:MAG: gfo/Idh/MocA family oxidoreductase, partial [Paracoccus sp. (in: a-proteobacteria)]|nr:gfo/Idh/MocA family oxidoreductase [Paracoccus sp. (in: a-proteobacteria)]
MSLKIGLVGLGTIARAQHLPASAATDGLTLTAIASRKATLAGVANHRDLVDMLGEVDAVTLCTPP